MTTIAAPADDSARWLRCTRCRTLMLRYVAESVSRDGVLRCSGCGHHVVPVNLRAEHEDAKAKAAGGSE